MSNTHVLITDYICDEKKCANCKHSIYIKYDKSYNCGAGCTSDEECEEKRKVQ